MTVEPVISILSLKENGDVLLHGNNGNNDVEIRGKWSIDENDNTLNLNVERTYSGKYLDYTVHSFLTGKIYEDSENMMYIRGKVFEDDADYEGNFVLMPTISRINVNTNQDIKKVVLKL